MTLIKYHILTAFSALLMVYVLISYETPLGFANKVYKLMVHARQGVEVKVWRKDIKADSIALNFILIMCGGNNTKGELAPAQGRQIEQAEVLLKSASLLTKRKLHFHVVVDSSQVYAILMNRIATNIYKERLSLSMQNIWYPEDRQDMRNMFRPCATERLFIPDIFPDMDRAIYIDTDFIFMRPPEDLWAFFDSFSSTHIAAMAPAMYWYGSARNKVPYYGESGLNAGVMLMDLNRMKRLPGGWTEAAVAIKDKYKNKIKLADQDILNILFSFSPERVFELPCEWNFRACLCMKGKNRCPSAKTNGVPLLHGNAKAFVSGTERKIQALYEGFKKHRLGEDSLAELYNNLRTTLKKIQGRDLRSKCHRVPGIDDILLRELGKHAARSP